MCTHSIVHLGQATHIHDLHKVCTHSIVHLGQATHIHDLHKVRTHSIVHLGQATHIHDLHKVRTHHVVRLFLGSLQLVHVLLQVQQRPLQPFNLLSQQTQNAHHTTDQEAEESNALCDSQVFILYIGHLYSNGFLLTEACLR